MSLLYCESLRGSGELSVHASSHPRSHCNIEYMLHGFILTIAVLTIIDSQMDSIASFTMATGGVISPCCLMIASHDLLGSMVKNAMGFIYIRVMLPYVT